MNAAWLSACLLSAVSLDAAKMAPAGEPPEMWVAANQAAQAGDLGAAIKGYEGLVEAGHGTGYVWYNLGNAYLRIGRLGPAIAAYLRAERQLPRDPDVAANLTFARQSTKDAIAQDPGAAVWRTLFFWHFTLASRELWAVALVANGLLWLLLAVGIRRRDLDLLRPLALAALVVFVTTFASAAWHTLAPRRVAVVDKAEVSVHAGTDRSSVVQFALHAGTETELIEERGDWLRIQLPDEKQGWVHRDDVITVTL
jgi:tetratricopeptide (TPR) repeat protein